MGYNNENLGEPIIIDLETVGRDGIESLLDPVSAPANYKDADKIAAKKAEKRQAILDKAALDSNLCRIVTIGTWSEATGVNVQTLRNEQQEKFFLGALAATITPSSGLQRRIVTFNGFGFDLRVLMARARLLRLPFPKLSVVPWQSPHLDLLQELSFYGADDFRSLEFYARLFDLTVDEPVTNEVIAVSGADVPRLVAAEEWDLIAGHCRYDILRTKALYLFGKDLRMW